MNCQETRNAFDDLLDDALPLPMHDKLHRHLRGCGPCREALAAEHALRRALRGLPVPPPSPGFAARALREAGATPQPRHGRMAFAAGFASAAAAGVVLWLVAALPGPFQSDSDATVPAVALAVGEVRTVNLVFDVPADLANATLAVRLPDDAEIKGLPGQRSLTWQTSLRKGENLLALPLVLNGAGGGVLTATVSAGEQQKEFRIRLTAAGRQHSQRV